MDIARLSVSPLRRHATSLALVAAGIAAFLLWWASPAAAATFTVNSANDVGDGTCDFVHCSLRDAINAANAAAGTDTIEFDIPALGVQTISPTSALPTITDPVIIDGYTQPGASQNTLAVGNDAVLQIELDGTSAPSGTNAGLTITGGGTTIRGLVINRFVEEGIEISGSGGNVIEGNYIGTNAAGTVDLGNSLDGVVISGSPSNTVGGTAPSARNVISGNGDDGIQINGSAATGNTVHGNYIGTDAAGTGDLGNTWRGVRIDGAPSNTVGGTTAGAGNVISGNDSAGVQIIGSAADSNIVEGNYVGTNAAGTGGLGNSNIGVWICGGASNSIGGTAAGARNVISANVVGVHIGCSGATGNTVQGNYIGTDVTGTFDLGNTYEGVSTTGDGSNTIGGTAAGAGNLISGNNGHGVYVLSSSAPANTIQGNYIGTNAAGTADLGNSLDGVRIEGSPNNTIGGTAAGARNVISGNNTHGVEINGGAATGNTVLGNYIGTNAAGAASLGNSGAGVFVNGASGNTIGGTTPAARNVISGNNLDTSIGFAGIDITGTGNFVQGNYLGTNAAGTAAIPNVRDGILVRNNGNTVGGAAAGAGNLISGNTEYGVNIFGGSNNTVQGNLVGTNAAGTADLGNGRDGVRVLIGSNNAIGGTTAGAGNVISGNGWAGVHLFGGSTSLTTVQGNHIGTNTAGTADLGNSIDGVFIEGSPNNTIGGTAAGSRNVISGNDNQGVYIHGAGATGNMVQGNFIGTNAAGTADLGNTSDGVVLDVTSSNTIGGTAAGAGNVISGNNTWGVRIVLTTGTTLQGNYIGTNAAGSADLGNSRDGVFIDRAPSNTIGGTAAGARNLISGNDNRGVLISGFGATGNTVQGNYIGTDATGTDSLGNTSDGVHIIEGTNNTIGGTAAGAGNVISGNSGDGVRTAGVNGATIQGNFIGTSAAGDFGLANGGEGVHISGSANIMVGGTAAGAGNVISGNVSHGVQVEGCCGTNTIQGNYIGTNAAGTGALANANGVLIFSDSVVVGGTSAGARNVISGNNGDGVVINGSLSTIQGNFIGTNAAGTGTVGGQQFNGVRINSGSNTIGGTTAGAGNVISGNSTRGVFIAGGGATSNTLQGNYIGTDAAGTAALGNFWGIAIEEAPSNTIGGPAAGAGNVISGNDDAGVLIYGLGATSNTLQGNYIGTDAAGTADVGNTDSGVFIFNGSSNSVGGTAAGAGNTIAFNGGDGVTVVDASSIAHLIRGNSTHSNDGLGLDLGNDGVTANDPGDGDTGPNELQNFPVLTSASGAGSSVLVEGTLNSTPNTDFDLDFYKNDECDPARHGEGQTYLGSFAVSTDSNGDASFSETVPSSVAAGQFVTGTATDPNGNTSEFSLCNPPPTIVVTNTDDSGAGSLRAAIASANASPGPDTIEFDLPGLDYTIDLASALPVITDPVVIDGTTQPGFSGSPIVELNGAGAGATADGLKITAGDSTVRGLVINSFGGDGIELNGGDGNTIRGNYLGTDVAGSSALGNSVGLRIVNSSGNFIGGASAGMGNLISGNSGRGVALLGASSTGNVVRGNLIGTDAAGTGNLGNGVHGVSISMSSSNTTIGGQGPNTIAFNGDDGVWIGAGTGNRVLRNSIRSNGGLGIDLGTDGVTANDTGDEDTGANMLQNFPVLDAALVGGGATAVFGTLESEADTDYRLHFWHSASCDPSGNGEGETYLGSKLVSTDGDGLASFRATFAQIAQNRHVTAVAVDPAGNTSEFSGCEPTTLRPTLAIDDVTVGEGNSGTTPATFTVTRSGNTGGTSSVNFATANVTAVAPGDYTTTSGTLSFGAGETTKTITVNVVGDTLDEAHETFRVNLSAPVDATVSDNQGVGTITDDDPAPTLSISDATVMEPDSGTNKAIFTVTLSAASAQTVTVNYSTADGTATAPADYTATSGTLTFAPGVTTRTINVAAKGENLVEPNETFFVNLTAPTNATFGDNQGQGTIQNDD